MVTSAKACAPASAIKLIDLLYQDGNPETILRKNKIYHTDISFIILMNYAIFAHNESLVWIQT